jgi:hypothetical protein
MPQGQGILQHHFLCSCPFVEKNVFSMNEKYCFHMYDRGVVVVELQAMNVGVYESN